MLRMAHRLRSCKVLSVPHHEWLSGELRRPLDDALQSAAEAEVFIIDNIAESCIWSDSNTSPQRIVPHELPCLAAPFSKILFEYIHPEERNLQVGVLLESVATADYPTSDYYAMWGETPRWIVSLNFFVSVKGIAIYQRGAMLYALRDDGKAVKEVLIIGVDRNSDEQFHMTNLAKPVWMALAMCHMKNVSTIDETEKHSPADKWLRRMRQPKITYRILNIEPAKVVLRNECHANEIGYERAMHLVRGHFATYTEESPLFGRFVGTVWKPSHVRGDIKSGAVVKDYSVSQNANRSH